MVPSPPDREQARNRSPRSGGDGPELPPEWAILNWFSPLRRGWSLSASAGSLTLTVLPAQAGMVRPASFSLAGWVSSPRSGGDGPCRGLGRAQGSGFSPLRRGWSPGARTHLWGLAVLPAQAGMVPSAMSRSSRAGSSPRSGGDGPVLAGGGFLAIRFSPLRRGWSEAIGGAGTFSDVLPAQAGMVRWDAHTGITHKSSPRSGGDGPTSSKTGENHEEFSPLRRGWSLLTPAALA